MTGFRTTAAAAILLAAAVSVYGEPPKARWARGWEAAVAEAKDRNVPILLFMHKDGDTACDDQLAVVLRHLEFANVSKGWVNVYANEQTEHGTVKSGETETCKLFPGMPCQQHVLNWGQATKAFFKGTFTPPGVLWCDADGKELGRHEGAWPKKELFDAMKEAIKKQGPGLGADEYDFAVDQMAEGDAFAADPKSLPKALTAYLQAVRKIEKISGAKKVLEKAKKGYAGLEARVRIQIDKYREYITGGAYADAVKGLTPIARDYKGHAVGAEADKALKEAESRLGDDKKKK
jgi:hypothetical protein